MQYQKEQGGASPNLTAGSFPPLAGVRRLENNGSLPTALSMMDQGYGGRSVASIDSEMMALFQAQADLARMQARLRAQREHMSLAAAPQWKLQNQQPAAMIKRSAEVLEPAFKPVASGVSSAADDSEQPKKKARRGKKPADMPRRALSAYNIFFSEQRELILKEIDSKNNGDEGDSHPDHEEESKAESSTAAEEDPTKTPSVCGRTFFPKRSKRPHRKVHGKIGLVSLARTVSQRWKDLSDEKRQKYKDLADQDKQRHKQAMEDYKQRKEAQETASATRGIQGMAPLNQSFGQQEVDAGRLPPMYQNSVSAHPQITQMPQAFGHLPQPGLSMRDSMAEQYQRRYLAEMLGASKHAMASQGHLHKPPPQLVDPFLSAEWKARLAGNAGTSLQEKFLEQNLARLQQGRGLLDPSSFAGGV